MKYWSCDLATGVLATSPDNATWTPVPNVVFWKLGFEWDADTGKSVIGVFVKVTDAVGQGVVQGQGAGMFQQIAGYVPTREFRSAHIDAVTVLFNGVAAGTVVEATGFPPGGPLATRPAVDSAFKADV